MGTHKRLTPRERANDERRGRGLAAPGLQKHGRHRDQTREGRGNRLEFLVSLTMRIEMPFTVLALIASVVRFSGAARSADHHIWAKQPREITSNSLLDLEDNDEPIVGGGVGGGRGGAKDASSDFKTRL